MYVKSMLIIDLVGERVFRLSSSVFCEEVQKTERTIFTFGIHPDPRTPPRMQDGMSVREWHAGESSRLGDANE